MTEKELWALGAAAQMGGGMAMGVINPYANASTLKKPDTFTGSAADMLSTLMGSLEIALKEQADLMDRLFGELPQSSGVSGARETRPGNTGQLLSQIEHAQMLAGQVQINARTLNSRL